MSSDFFALNDKEFARVLQGWKHPNPPVKAARELRGVNPFTGEELVLKTHENPVQPEADKNAVKAPVFGKMRKDVVSWEWVTQFEVAEIGVAFELWGTVEDGADALGWVGLIGPSNACGSVHEIPNALLRRLAASDDGELQVRGAAWMRLRGEYPDWNDDDAQRLLRDLRGLCRHAEATARRVYLHCGEP
jgi:hypothetical protein